MERVFRCEGCAYCCFFSRVEESPVLFSWERRRLIEVSEKLGIPMLNTDFEPLEFYRRGDTCIVLLYRWVIRGFCPFYDPAGSRCLIHPVKPSSCRMYPLILEVPTGRLSISGACRWVERNKWVIRAGDKLDKIMPVEFRTAVRVYAEYMESVKLLESEGFTRETDKSRCSRFIDFEDFVAGGGVSGEKEEGG